MIDTALPTPRQLELLRLLDENDGLYDFDEQLQPFWDSTGGESDKPDILRECCERGWVDGETCNHSDLFYLTVEGRAFARSVDEQQAPDAS